MTKKRFIKLLMSHGEPIHRARAIAFLYNSRNIPYKEAYSDYLIRHGIKNAFSRMAKAMVEAGENIKAITISLGKLKEAIKGGT